MNREAVNILFPIVTPGSRPGAKYGDRYLWDEWMDVMTGVGWCRLPHADGTLCHLMHILNITECCWFNLTRNSHTYLTWPLSECTSQGPLTTYLLINGNRQEGATARIKNPQLLSAQLVKHAEVGVMLEGKKSLLFSSAQWEWTNMASHLQVYQLFHPNRLDSTLLFSHMLKEK